MKKGLVAVLIATVGVLGLVSGGLITRLIFKPVEATTESSNTQVIQAVSRQQDVVLLKLGIQGIASQQQQSKILGLDVPGTERVLYLQYNYSALLGVDGSKVNITSNGEHSYQLHVPEFTLLGHDDVTFHKAVEKNGVISIVTPEIDVAQMTSHILNSDSIEQLLRSNDEQLRDQCKRFYEGIIKSVDPEASVTFTFPTT